MYDDEKCCGTCRFHRYSQEMQDWWCANHDAEDYTDFTGYRDGKDCENWEGRK